MAQAQAELSTSAVDSYRWGKIQSILLILMGVAGIIGDATHASFPTVLSTTLLGAGLFLLWRMKPGPILLAGLSCYLIFHLAFDGGYPRFSVLSLLFFGIPALIYYPKRWREFTWNGRKSTPPTETQKVDKTLLPDFGVYLASQGTPQKTMFIYTSWEMDVLQVVGLSHYCTTRVQPHEGKLYCATFDFGDDQLFEFLKLASDQTLHFVSDNLVADPESTRNLILPDPISTGIGAILGNIQQGRSELFLPLIITDVLGLEEQ